MYAKQKSYTRVLIVFLCLLSLLALLAVLFRTPILKLIYKNFELPAPSVCSEWEGDGYTVTEGDIYVSKNGSDANDGTRERPFLTLARALEAVALTDRAGRSEITVCIEAGVYAIDSLTLSEQHGGTEECRVIYSALCDGEVILNAGVDIDPAGFVAAVQYPEIEDRLSPEARGSVYVLDLTREPYCLTEDDFGRLYPIGTYNTAGGYSGDTTGPMYAELFINGTRQSLARYPNGSYAYTDTVIASGKSSPNRSNGDPAGDVLRVDDELASRISSWHSTEDVWMYGFWQYDWADGSTPIDSFDGEENILTTKYQSFFGVKENAPYYFYNCLEELDCDNEWYLDRENGLLCVYRSGGLDSTEISMSTSTATAITVNASYVTLNGLTVTGTRSDGIYINGSGNTVTGCTVKSIGGHAVQMFGYNNRITRNEIFGIGRGGISVTGGDSTTLTPGSNTVSNNLIHGWSEVYKTYQAGINIGGVGNICANNELYDSPHLAITYGGCNHIVEYNLIHDVCLESDDAGAIYAGKSWSSYGNDIRYNLIYNVGSDGYSPNGIYMDDAISGQSIYGNILINIPKHAIFIGGGRDMNVYGNLILNSQDDAIRYDARARDGLLSETWFSSDVRELLRAFSASPWRSEVWQTAFPQYRNATDDPSRINDPAFMANPANSFIGDNVIFDRCASLGNIDKAVDDFSEVAENGVHYLFGIRSTFPNLKNGDYTTDTRSPLYDKCFNDVLKRVGRY